MAKIKERADQLVFQQGLTSSREQAKRLIMAGEIQFLESCGKTGMPLKPGQMFPVETQFILKQSERYVSRGAYKLLTILEYEKLDVTNYVCLDAGASTGGFTDCLLQNGARRVYAIDVGHNQLHEKLRGDSRVISHEGVNLRNPPHDLVPEPIDLITCDVSFISLTLIIPPCLQWLRPDGKLICLIKPQFELGPKETVKGVVRSEAAQKRAVEKIVSFATNYHLHLRSLLPSQIKGPKGNQEYLALFEFL